MLYREEKEMSFKWIRIQTHVHTVHSDGKNTLEEMACEAKETEINAMFLTDHNTMSGEENAKEVCGKIGIDIIQAIEYTTFYGHIIALGAPYFRWDKIDQHNLNALADHVHKYNGIIGIAHPRQIGDPISTGAAFNFKAVDFKKIDFIEVWHGVSNKNNEWENNEKFWLDIVKFGNDITCLYGGDFHKKEQFKESEAFNWIQITEGQNITEAIKAAIINGRIIMSKGPCFNMTIESDKFSFSMGDTVEGEGKPFHNVCIEPVKNTFIGKIKVKLVDNIGVLYEIDYKEQEKIIVTLTENIERRWVRTEIIDSIKNELLAVSNPIYFES
jgi:hypothetical protein